MQLITDFRFGEIGETVLSSEWLLRCSVAVVSLFVGALAATRWHSFIYRNRLDSSFSDRPFTNGLSLAFALRVMIQGANFNVIYQLLSDQVRNRLYVGHKKWIFWGDEHWFAGHPVMAAHVFGAQNAKNWTRLDQEETLKAFYFNQISTSKQPRNLGLLYLGDSQDWKTMRGRLHPFFSNTDFVQMEPKMRAIGRKHLDRVMAEHAGLCELLQECLILAVDLLCQTLYGCELTTDELETLATAVVEYTVPDGKRRLIGLYGVERLDANLYHKKVANRMGDQAPENTMASIIKNCPNASDKLKYENIGFFLEAITPAFAAFWTICCVTSKDLQSRCQSDAVFRQQCIKEAIRLYPPVPALWPRMATRDHEMENPLYDPDPRFASRTRQSMLTNVLFGPPVETQKTIHIKKGTKVFFFPSVLHYDDRFWKNAASFLPARWNDNPELLDGRKRGSTNAVKGDKDESSCDTAARKENASSFREAWKQELAPFYGGPADRESLVYHCCQTRNLRTLVFGAPYEVEMFKAGIESVLERTADEMDRLKRWAYIPFGAGSHICLGRRVAISMVDAIVTTFLEYGVTFVGGIPATLLSNKPWHQRITSFAAAYNYPCDPVGCHLTRTPEMPVTTERQ